MDLELIWTGGEPIDDYGAAYDNGASVADAQAFLPRWQADAKAFRDRLSAAGRAELKVPYGDAPRQHFDLFWPEDGKPKGLVVFIHGGYWKSQEIGNWSHFAGGALARQFAVALPEYTLCPQATVAQITREIGSCLDQLAERIEGPLRLSGHSAGGHLVTRMLCTDAPIASRTARRIDRTVSISGCHDLRPIMRSPMNETLRLNREMAAAESPALLEPREGVDLVCLVGGDELLEFRRQNTLLANAWHGFGVKTKALEQPGRHHFNIVDDMIDPDSELVAILTDAASS